MKRFQVGTHTNHKRKAMSQRSNTKVSPEFLEKLKTRVDADGSVTYRTLARDLHVCRSTIGTGVRKLGYKSYTIRKRHFLTDEHKRKRVTNAQIMLNSINDQVLVFEDEKLFFFQEHHNPQHSRWIAA
jgi:hypothetical protein